MIDLAIIGAGPYGLSLAAHLNARGVNFRIFGPPMQTWLDRMPKGMKLKSEGFASSLYDPAGEFPLKEFCREKGLSYEDVGLPVPLETFSSYGLEFQKRFVPNLENKWVTTLRRVREGFEICLDTGEEVKTRAAVIAVGLTYFAQMPSVLSGLSPDFVSHSNRYGPIEHFEGREVAIVGAGASAIDLAALLQKAGSKVHVISRGPQLRFQSPPVLPRPLKARIDAPMTGIGPGWRNLFCTEAPLIFRLLPENIRLEAVKRMLGPAPCWFTRDEVVGKVNCHLSCNVAGAHAKSDRIMLELSDASGTKQVIEADHVISATGYKPDLRRIAFLSPEIQDSIATVANTPVLSSTFESSIDKLYFVGITAANTFGPVLRFAYGAGFASRRLAAHLSKSVSRGVVQAGVPFRSAPSRKEL
jgi:thioredoxin reductase